MPDRLHPEERTSLEQLVELITRWGLRGTVAFLLDLLSPFDVINSQLALFAHPFSGNGKWEQYLRALTKEAGWQMFRQLLDEQAQSEQPETQTQSQQSETQAPSRQPEIQNPRR